MGLISEPFLHCPIDPNQSQLWFINVWKSIIDPTLNNHPSNYKIESEFIEWIYQTYPWGHDNGSLISILDLNQPKNENDALVCLINFLSNRH